MLSGSSKETDKEERALNKRVVYKGALARMDLSGQAGLVGCSSWRQRASMELKES